MGYLLTFWVGLAVFFFLTVCFFLTVAVLIMFCNLRNRIRNPLLIPAGPSGQLNYQPNHFQHYQPPQQHYLLQPQYRHQDQHNCVRVESSQLPADAYQA